MEQSEYLKLLNENIAKHYQKAPSNMKANIEKTSSEIAKKLEVDNRVQKFTTNNAIPNPKGPQTQLHREEAMQINQSCKETK